MDIGELDLVKPDILPNDNVPHGFNVVLVDAIPTRSTALVVDNILQVIIPAVATLENASILYTLLR